MTGFAHKRNCKYLLPAAWGEGARRADEGPLTRPSATLSPLTRGEGTRDKTTQWSDASPTCDLSAMACDLRMVYPQHRHCRGDHGAGGDEHRPARALHSVDRRLQHHREEDPRHYGGDLLDAQLHRAGRRL